MTTTPSTRALTVLFTFTVLAGCGATDLSSAISDRPEGSPAFTPVTPRSGEQAVLRADGFSLVLRRDGRTTLTIAGDEYVIESRFSAPGDAIVFNPLPVEDVADSRDPWQPVVMQISATEAVLSAECPAYRFKRRVRIDAGRIRFFDTFTNGGDEPVGVLIRHSIIAARPFERALIGGDERAASSPYGKANPTVFLSAAETALGFLAEDNVLRLQMNAAASGNAATVRTDHFGLDAGAGHTFEWTLYPFERETGYFDFINRVRRDWKVDHPVEGPWDFLQVQYQADMLNDPDRLAAYLEKKRIGIVALSPWLGFENPNRTTGRLVERTELKEMLRPAIDALRAADPEIRVTGSLESFPMPLSLEDVQTLLQHLPEDQRTQGYRWVERDFIAALPSVARYDLEDAIQNRDGKILAMVYYRTMIPDPDEHMVLGAVCTYPAPGNAQHERLMDQARFLIEEVGLDGLYVDSFNFAWGNTDFMYSHHKWDGTTVDIDPATGRIVHRYLNIALVGGPARAELIRYCLDRGKMFVANTFPSVRETQNLGTMRFTEAEWAVSPLELEPGTEPPVIDRLCAGHLSTPIGLGIRVHRLGIAGLNDYTRIVMKTVMTHLRNGSFYYYYLNDIPETGPGAGAYGPLNHMFPLTPVRLGKGFIEGGERIVACVSGSFTLPAGDRPTILLFDLEGRPVDHDMRAVKKKDGWRIDLEIEDWRQIAVVEGRMRPASPGGGQ